MPAASLTIQDLRNEVKAFGEAANAERSEEDLFIGWFLRAYAVEDEAAAVRAVTNGVGDRGLDGVHIDDGAKRVYLVQTKFRKQLFKNTEGKEEVNNLIPILEAAKGTDDELAALTRNLREDIRAPFLAARERLQGRSSYALEIVFVSTGRCSKAFVENAARLERRYDGVEVTVFDGKRVVALLRDYLDGVAPAIPLLKLPVEGSVKGGGAISRFDPDTRIESWMFSMNGSDVGHLYRQAGVRIFARNIRGYLGSTQINESMHHTLGNEPNHFWYFNNGVTIVCDSARSIQERGAELIEVRNPQIINGQQTTRTLEAHQALAARSSVLIRVIAIPRDPSSQDGFERLVSKIVKATNWQNAIRASDLVTNDRRQIEIERELNKLGYGYIRKRTRSKHEARQAAGRRFSRYLTKEDIARAVSGCLQEALIYKGREKLFEEPNYDQIFGGHSIPFMLNCYWMMREIDGLKKGNSQRSWARYLVLYFVWSHLSSEIRASRNRFRVAMETKDEDVVKSLRRVAEPVFVAALDYYRRNRVEDGRIIDVPTFFKRQQHLDFAQYWRGAANSSRRKRFQEATTRFAKALNDYEA